MSPLTFQAGCRQSDKIDLRRHLWRFLRFIRRRRCSEERGAEVDRWDNMTSFTSGKILGCHRCLCNLWPVSRDWMWNVIYDLMFPFLLWNTGHKHNVQFCEWPCFPHWIANIKTFSLPKKKKRTVCLINRCALYLCFVTINCTASIEALKMHTCTGQGVKWKGECFVALVDWQLLVSVSRCWLFTRYFICAFLRIKTQFWS